MDLGILRIEIKRFLVFIEGLPELIPFAVKIPEIVM